jgi:hypothetical protein
VPHFLSLEDVLLIHSDQVDLYGGEPTMRDLNLLESAIAQPQATFGGNLPHGVVVRRHERGHERPRDGVDVVHGHAASCRPAVPRLVKSS